MTFNTLIQSGHIHIRNAQILLFSAIFLNTLNVIGYCRNKLVHLYTF